MKVLICSYGHNLLRNHRINRFAFDQARALRNAGHDVRIASIDVRHMLRLRRPGDYVYELDGIKCYTSNYFHLPVLYSPTLEPAKKNAEKLLFRIYKEWEPNVVHAHFLYPASWFAATVNKKKTPFVITEHHSKLNVSNPPEYLVEMAKKTYSQASALLAVSSGLARNINILTGFEPIVVPNVVEGDFFASVQNKKRKNSSFTFLSCAHLIKRKGFDVLLKAFAGTSSSAKLIIMGGGEENRRLHKLVRELEIENRVTFFGSYSRDEMRKIAEGADCFVLASRSETFGVVYAEAMAMGLPVIATQCNGPEDFVNKEVGRLVPVDDVEALRGEMERMVVEKEVYNSRYISDYTRERFAPEAIASRLGQIYSEVISQC